MYVIDGQEYYRDFLTLVFNTPSPPYHEASGYGNLSLIPEEWLEQQFTGSEILSSYDKTDNGAPFALIKDRYVSSGGYNYVYYYLFSKEEGYQLPEVYERTYNLKQLDEKFIPDTIARTEDLVQSDFEETDSTSLAYIKNKPDENTAMELAAEAGLIDPVTDENGIIYTDKNGEILSL